MSRVSLIEAPCDELPTEPLTWKDHGGDIWCVCEKGHLAALDHDIDDETGNVSPSVVCPECAWHVWVKLEGWSHE